MSGPSPRPSPYLKIEVLCIYTVVRRTMNIGSGVYSSVTLDTDGMAAKHMQDFRVGIKEALVMSSLSHPNIVKAERVAVKDGEVTIFMRMYPANLREKMRTSIPMDLRDFLKICIGLFSAANHMNRRRVIHCDIKPENILLNSVTDVTPVICDFNISKLDVAGGYFDGYIQTRPYRAPEVKFGSSRARYSHIIDVWSIGCILWEILTGSVLNPHEYDDTSVGVCRWLGFDGEDRKHRMAILKTVKRETVHRRTADTLRRIYIEKMYEGGTPRVIIHEKMLAKFLPCLLGMLSGVLLPNRDRFTADKALELTIDIVSQCSEISAGINAVFTNTKGKLNAIRDMRKTAHVGVVATEEHDVLEGCDISTKVIADKLSGHVGIPRQAVVTRQSQRNQAQYIPPVLTQQLIRVACAYIACCVTDSPVNARVDKYLNGADLHYTVDLILSSIGYDIAAIL